MEMVHAFQDVSRDDLLAPWWARFSPRREIAICFKNVLRGFQCSQSGLHRKLVLATPQPRSVPSVLLWPKS